MTTSDDLILSIDPSSTCTGAAVMRAPDVLVDQYRIKPDKGLDGRHDGADAARRALSMVADLRSIIVEHKVPHVVIEMPAQRPPQKLREKGVQNQAAYGVGVGVIWHGLMAMRDELGIEIHAVRADEWSRVPKDRRAALIAMMYPGQYQRIGDDGFNVADAIGLGRWWLGARAAQVRKVGA